MNSRFEEILEEKKRNGEVITISHEVTNEINRRITETFREKHKSISYKQARSYEILITVRKPKRKK